MYKLGLSSFSFGWKIIHDPAWSPLDLLEVAKRENVPVLQFGDNMPLDSLDESALYVLSTGAEKAGIVLEVGMRGLFVDEVRRYLEICRMVKSTFLRIVIDRGESEPDVPETIERLRQIVPLLEKYDVVLGIENHDRFRSRVLAKIVDAIGSPYVGICLDTANSVGAGEGVEETVRILAPYTVNLHVKDFVVRRVPSQFGFVVAGAAAGAGLVDLPWVLKQLPRKTMSVILELWPPQLATVPETLALEQRWVEESLEYLRKTLAAHQPS